MIGYRFVHDHRAEFPIVALCRIGQVNRSGYYAWRNRTLSPGELEDAYLANEIFDIWVASRRTYGRPRVWGQLRRHGRRVSPKRVGRLMASCGWTGVHGRRRWRRPNGKMVPLPDLLARDFTAPASDLRWVADITEFACRDGKLYLAGLVDLHDRGIVGWSMGQRQTTDLVVAALVMALGRRDPSPELLHHADHGTQGEFRWSSQHLDGGGANVFKHQQVQAIREMRGKMWSPGRPSTARREDRVRFWEAIAAGASSEDAAVEAGVSSAVGTRWFRDAGGMPSLTLAPSSGRYLSFAEREEIALLHAQELGVPRDRPSARSGSVDDLAGAAPQRSDAQRRADVSGHDRAVARRAARASTQGRQARGQRSAPGLRAGPPGRRDRHGPTASSWRGRRCAWIGRRHGRRARTGAGRRRGAPSRSRNRLAGRLPR